MLGALCKCFSVLVALVAIFVGLVASGFISEHTSFFPWLDGLLIDGKPQLKGTNPAFHKGTPWGFTFEELNTTDLSNHLVVITGGNAGLGFWSAVHIAQRNAQVVITCRRKARCQRAAVQIKEMTGKSVDHMVCDLASFKSILGFTKEFKRKYKAVDSLMLNAGIADHSFELTEDGLETIMGVNHFGHVLLTQELLPLVEVAAKNKGVATIVAVSSAGHFSSYPQGILPSLEAMADEARFDSWEAYCQSKLANVLFAQDLALQLKAKNILVNSCHPGLVTTRMQKLSVELHWGKLGKQVKSFMENLFAMMSWTARDAALTQVYLAVGEKVKREKITGKYFHPIARETTPDPHTKNTTLIKHLMHLTNSFIEMRRKELA